MAMQILVLQPSGDSESMVLDVIPEMTGWERKPMQQIREGDLG